MHTIEASVLVPFGLGLMVMTIMLTFFLHDQTVLEAEQASTVLKWQMSVGGWDEKTCDKEAGQWGDRLLISKVTPLTMKAGGSLFNLKTKESFNLFDRVLGMMDQTLPEEDLGETKTWLKINPFWLKRIWKVVEGS